MWRTHQYKYVRRPDEADELYALADDPGERINRIDDPQLAPIAQEMRLAMLDEMIRTADAVPIDTTRPE
jgi:arylsulfatase A-like enzyme